jgi:hypothetical protein
MTLVLNNSSIMTLRLLVIFVIYNYNTSHKFKHIFEISSSGCLWSSYESFAANNLWLWFGPKLWTLVVCRRFIICHINLWRHSWRVLIPFIFLCMHLTREGVIICWLLCSIQGFKTSNWLLGIWVVKMLLI